jgi:hypothetical protein
MGVQIRSISPTERQTGTYEFKVDLEVDGKPHRGFTVNDASMILDFEAFQIAVANHTGCYFGPEVGEEDSA